MVGAVNVGMRFHYLIATGTTESKVGSTQYKVFNTSSISTD